MKHSMKSLQKVAGHRDPSRGMTVQNLELISTTTANVLLHFAGGRHGDLDLDSAIGKAFDNKVRVLPGSAYHPIAGDTSLVTAMVAVNQETRAAGDKIEDAYDGLTAITASVFQDEDDAIWRKIGDGEAAFLVKDSDDDLSAILEARQADSIVTASARLSLHEKAESGQPIGWYDTGKEVMRYGACLASITRDDETVVLAMDSDDGALCEIDSRQVAMVDDTTPLSIRAEIATGAANIISRSGLNRQNFLQAWLRYAQQIYGGPRSPYYKRMKNLMSHAFGHQAVRTV